MKIEDETIGRLDFQEVEKLVPGREHFGIETGRAQQAFECSPHRKIIIDNGNSRSHIAHQGKSIAD
jgi:hypothetical protein